MMVCGNPEELWAWKTTGYYKGVDCPNVALEKLLLSQMANKYPGGDYIFYCCSLEQIR